MKFPGFRPSMYLGFALCLACLCSPFGWGVTHHPHPWANLLLSFSYYGMVILAGIRLIQALLRSSVAVMGLLFTLAVFLVIAVAFLGGTSLVMQLSTSRGRHEDAILYVLAALAGIVFLKVIEEQSGKGSRPIHDGNARKPPVDDLPT